METHPPCVALLGSEHRGAAHACGAVHCLSEAAQQEKWSRELAAWKTVVGEHDRLMQGWRKAWVCT